MFYTVCLLSLPAEDQWRLNSTTPICNTDFLLKPFFQACRDNPCWDHNGLIRETLQSHRRYYTTVFTSYTVHLMNYKLDLFKISGMLLQLFLLFSTGSEYSRWMLSVPVPWVPPPGWFKRYRRPLTHTPLTSTCCLLHRPACASTGRYWNTHRYTPDCMQHLILTLPIYSHSNCANLTGGDFSCFLFLYLCIFILLFLYHRVCLYAHACVFAISRTEQVKWLTAYNQCLSWLSVLTLICHISHSRCGLLAAQTAM